MQSVTSAGYTYKTVPADPMKARFYTLKMELTVILTVNKKNHAIAALNCLFEQAAKQIPQIIPVCSLSRTLNV